MYENGLKGTWNRILQSIARGAPGAQSLRVALHRWRGVSIGADSWIGYDCILDTSRPDLIRIGERVTISIRVTLVAHFIGPKGIVIEDDAFIGPGSIILPGVKVGQGAVLAAGSVLSSSLPPMTLAQGNPARPIATCGVPLRGSGSLADFQRALRPLRTSRPSRSTH